MTRFFLLAFLLAWAVTVPLAFATHGVLDRPPFPPVLGWSIGLAPIVAAVLVTRRTADWTWFRNNALRFRVSWTWYAIALALPWLLLAAAFAVRDLLDQPLPTIQLGPSLFLLGIAWLVLAFGEEAGWRGFSLPKLVGRWGFARAATLLGVLWCVWHYPKLLSNPYLALDRAGLAALGQFSLQIVVANYLICWLFVASGSVAVVALFHASFNVVSTAYPAAAIDPALTTLLALAALIAIGLDRSGAKATAFTSGTAERGSASRASD